MIIGIPKEIMNHEYRVGLVPNDVKNLKQSNFKNTIIVESNLGSKIGYSDEDYKEAGAEIVKDVASVWDCEFIIKCKEPLESEFKYLKKDMILYSFLDLAYSKELANALINSKVISICAETIEGPNKNYPVLLPMSEIAGKVGAQLLAQYLCTHEGGAGILIGGIAGTPPAKVVVVGGGNVGMSAARVLSGMGADVWVLDIDVIKLSRHPLVVENKVKVLYANEDGINYALDGASGVIGSVLVTATSTPKVIKKKHLKLMKKGGVIIDVAADLGGCVESIIQTTHDDPVYEFEGILHYGVPNIPGIVARTSSISYSNESLPYITTIANEGFKEMLKMPNALSGINAFNGYLTIKSIADNFNLPYLDPINILN